MSVKIQPIVRLATHEDVPKVIALVTEVLAEYGLSFNQGSKTDQELYELPTSYTKQQGAFWVAFDGETLLGTCGVASLSEGSMEIRKMYLHKQSRGRGIGHLLYTTAETWAKEHGAKELVLDTTEQMKQAIRFYESHGFVRDDTQVRGSRCSRGYRKVLTEHGEGKSE